MDGRDEAGANDGTQVGGTGAAQAKEQEVGGQQNEEPVTEKATPTTAEKEGGTNGEAPPGGDNSAGPANTNDGHGDGKEAARDEEQEVGGQQNEEPVTEKATPTPAEKDSTEVSNNAGLAGEPVLPGNSNPEQGQGDNGERSEGGTNGEAPPGGDNSAGPADTNDGHGDGKEAARDEEQEVGGQQNEEPVTGRTTSAADEKEATTDASDPEGADSDEPRPPQRPLVAPEDVGPAADETDSEPIVGDVAVRRSGNTTYLLLLAAVLVGLFAIWLVPDTLQPPAEQQAFPQVNLFIGEMNALETRFTSQRLELWKRSRVHLERHLRNARPTEPVSLILVAGRRAERTLDCLARGLAAAFSAAHNASVLHIDGAAAAGRDSDRVKMDIDGELQGAFGGGGDRPAAVIHRLEELPPASTLIFYRYCDHENAAFKKTFLLFTVLLDRPELGAELRLNDVEELVDERLQSKFISPGLSVAFDSMDRDKYSGLWSRISHLILPVAAQTAVERDGC